MAKAPLVTCRCFKCGRDGKTANPRPEFLCVRCYVERDLGRPITAADIQVVVGAKERVKKEWHS